MKTKSWMAEIDDEKDLLSLNIAGTHDCATQYIPLAHFSKCQNLSIYEQLNIGVRCLDIRVKPYDNTLMLIHGKCDIFVDEEHTQKMTMSDALDMCYCFLDENPSEAIILQFKNDDNKNMEECFDILYKSHIEPNLDKWYTENRSPKLSEVRGKIVLLRRCAAYENYSENQAGIDISGWVEQDEIVTTPLTLVASEKNNISFIIQDRFKYIPEHKWSKVIEPFLDSASEFNGEYIINYISTAGGVKGPFNNAQYINNKFADYQLKHGKYYGIIYCDFPTEEMVERIITRNL